MINTKAAVDQASASDAGGETSEFVSVMSRRTPRAILFPYTTLFRSLVSIPGTMSEKFYFTVREDSVAARINQSLGKRVALSYKQHIDRKSTRLNSSHSDLVCRLLLEKKKST